MKICIPIKEKSQHEVLKKWKKVAQNSEVAEIWLDQIEDLNLETLLKNRPTPVLLVCKSVAEGGEFKGNDEALASLLISTFKYNPDYVDLPFYMPEKLSKKIVQEAKKFETKIIISHHDFKRTPTLSHLKKLALDMQSRGGDIHKIATWVHDSEDLISLFELTRWLKENHTLHIVIGMGSIGQITRMKSPEMGNELTFAVLDKKDAEHGQMTVKRLRSVWKILGNKN